jgi:hypothetical protein
MTVSKVYNDRSFRKNMGPPFGTIVKFKVDAIAISDKWFKKYNWR